MHQFLRDGVTRVGFLALIGFAAISPLRATTIYSNLNPGQTTGVVIENFGGTTLSYGAAFTPSANYTLTDAKVDVLYLVNSASTFNLFLYSNNASGLPGSSIATLATGVSMGSVLDTPTVVTISGLSIALTSGTQYWLVMAPDVTSMEGLWVGGGTTPVAPAAVSADGSAFGSAGSPEPNPQFEVDGTLTPTPEPATMGRVLAGLGLAFAARKRASSKTNHR